MQSVENPSLITRQPNTFPSLCSQLPKPSQFSHPCKALEKQLLQTPLLSQKLPFKGALKGFNA